MRSSSRPRSGFRRLTLSNWFANIAGSAPAPKWVAVLDTSVLVPVLATALAAKADELLGPLLTKFIVSNNTNHFRPGQKPFGLHLVTAQMFWHYLQRGAKAKLP